MTVALEHPALAGLLDMLELEITGKCQLACTHCLSESSPQATHGTMTPADWQAVITDAAALGIRTVQLIGGEPTVHPHWRDFAELALSLGREVEIYTNLYRVRDQWWDLFGRPGVTLGTSFYSDDPAEHDRITGRPGSHARTRAHIREALARGIGLRVGIVHILPEQRIEEARADLLEIGVTRIGTDRVRAVGRASLPGRSPSVEELCGWCTRGRAAVLANGDLTGCVLSRDFPVGNVKEKRLAELLGGQEWERLAARIPVPRAGCEPCQPHDSEGCDPSNDACEPTD
ncbi:radical SAM protein [Streptomyces sp. NPDC050610]|uniref:radical SAM protein n=1 Tax=Streptomyces sp. NPDC050610 TaxID=3157097 RepID=UPI00342E5FD4